MLDQLRCPQELNLIKFGSLQSSVAPKKCSVSSIGRAGVRGEMQISRLLEWRGSIVCARWSRRRFIRKSRWLVSLLVALWPGGAAMAQGGPWLMQRDGRVISLVPYAPIIVRVTISTDAAAATSEAGYGFVGKPSAAGWTHERNAEGDIFRSARVVVRLSPENLPDDQLPKPMPLDALNSQLREIYFGGGEIG